jgi:hypothetical protein
MCGGLHGETSAKLHPGNVTPIHNVFPPPAATGTLNVKDPISEKNMLKGDGCWDTNKEILGYLLDGVNQTL